MAYSEVVATQVREELAGTPLVTEKKMFGGLAFLLRGNMCCGVIGDGIIVRVGAASYVDALAKPHARPFDMTGRAMAGWVVVEGPGIVDAASRRAWVDRGVAFAESLPPK